MDADRYMGIPKRYVMITHRENENQAIHELQDLEVTDLIVRRSVRTVELDFHTKLDQNNIARNTQLENSDFVIFLTEELDVALSKAEMEKSLDEAFYLINSGRYWQAHVLLETVWKPATKKKNREILRSLILLCASRVKKQMAQTVESKRLFDSAIRLLKENIDDAGLIWSILTEPENSLRIIPDRVKKYLS